MEATERLRPEAESAEHSIGLLTAHFFNRTDKVAALMEWGKPHPVQGEKHLDRLLRSHVLGDGAKRAPLVYWTKKRGPIASSGRPRIGTYAPTPDGKTRWICLDFDGKGHADPLVDADGAVITCWKRCQELGIPAHIERSGGGHGWHLWVFFDDLVPARSAIRLARHIAPSNQLLASGELADATKNRGIEIFPKQESIRKKEGLGNMVWLPFFHGAKGGANCFHRLTGDELIPYLPESLESFPSDALEKMSQTLPKGGKNTERVITPEESVRSYLGEVRTSDGSAPPSDDWRQWRSEVARRLPLEAIYGEWLTGAVSGSHWLECRDPDSPTGDRSPSAGVADGTGQAPRGTFHSHRTGETLSVFDFLIRHGQATDFMDAAHKVADLAVVPLPEMPKRKGKDGSGSNLPTIMISNRQFRDMVAEAWEAVRKANDPPTIFRRLDHVITLSRQTLLGKDNVVIRRLQEMAMYDFLSKAANWFRENGDGIFAAPPPKDVARDMLTVISDGLGRLDAVVFSPLFDGDGALLATPGYHRDAGLWLEFPHDFPVDDVPANPTPEQVSDARTLLLDELLVDFSFVDQSDRAHAVGAIILPFVRRMVGGCTPIHLIEAPTEGSGKGFVCHAISIVATGKESDPRILSQDENEARKLLTSELLGGRPIIMLDNVDDRRQLSSPALASVITAESWTDRMMFTQQTITVPNTAVWLLTGNNPKVSMEIARRCVRIRIDPKVDRPYLRANFKHDPFIPWVKANRMALARAVLVLVRAWLAADRPGCKRRLGSFEQWSNVIGGILEVAGIPGFLENLQALYETADVEGQAWREFVRVWWEAFGETPKKVSELNDLSEERELLLGVRGDKSPRSQQTRLGNALMNKRDRVFGGVRVVRLGLKGKGNCVHYALVPTEPKPAGDEDSQVRTSGPSENVEPQVLPTGSRPESRMETGDNTAARTCENLSVEPDATCEHAHDAHPHMEEELPQRFSPVLASPGTIENDEEYRPRTTENEVLGSSPEVPARGEEVLFDLATLDDNWDGCSSAQIHYGDLRSMAVLRDYRELRHG